MQEVLSNRYLMVAVVVLVVAVAVVLTNDVVPFAEWVGLVLGLLGGGLAINGLGRRGRGRQDG